MMTFANFSADCSEQDAVLYFNILRRHALHRLQYAEVEKEKSNDNSVDDGSQ